MTINEIFDHIDEMFAEKRISEVEPFLSQQLRLAETAGEQDKVIAICNELGGLYRATGRYDKGIPLYQKALDAIGSLDMNGTEAHATTLINFGTTYAAQGEAAEGLMLFSQAAEILSCIGLDRDYRMATLHNNMSILCQDSGDRPQAIEHLQKALGILQCLEDSETEIATTYSNMAQIYLLDNDLQKAADACGLSVSLFEKISGDSDVHYSAAIETRGQISLLRGEKDEALADFRKALSLIERDYGRDTPAANALHGLIARVEQEVDAK